MANNYEYEYLVSAPSSSNTDPNYKVEQKMTDIPSTFHRTNPVPLDVSSVISISNTDDSENGAFPTLEDLSEAAWQVIEEVAKELTTYPGQQITILGKVYEIVHRNDDPTEHSTESDQTEIVGKALSFIIQPANHAHRDDTLNEDSKRLPNSHITTAQELAYKSYVDAVDIDLREKIGNLVSIMNFRGVYESFTAVQEEAGDEPSTDNPKPGVKLCPGDVIVISGGTEDGTGANGKPGMEYVYTGDGTTHSWAELGFGSQIVTFLAGTAGLTLPTCPGIGTSTSPGTVLEYIQKADEAMANFIGGELDTEENTFKLPDTMPGGSATDINTILDYIQKSDNIIADFIRPNNSSSRDKPELKVPETLPDGSTNDAETVIEYIRNSDSAITAFIGANNSESLPKELYTAKTGSLENAETVLDYIQSSNKSIIDRLKQETNERKQADQAELEARINADLAEQVRTTNTDASIIAGPSFVRTDDNKLQWKSETQTLTYNKAFAEISEEGQEYVKIEEESITSCNGETYYLVAVKKDESKTSFAEFKLEGTTKIPLRELAIFGQEFSSDSSEGCFYIYNSLCYVNEDYSLKEALGTITTTISTDVSENGNAGWWCVSNDTRTVPVDSLLQIMSNVANVRDTLKVVQKEFITIEHEQDSEDTCLCINLNTFTTNINSSY